MLARQPSLATSRVTFSLPKQSGAFLFPEGIERWLPDPDLLSESTTIALQGLIEGKWVNRFLGHLDEWRPASMGNNLLAAGPGIHTTLGALEHEATGDVEITYQCERNPSETRTHRTVVADLRGQNILGLVREVLQVCREAGDVIDGIDLSAMGESAAIVNERWRFQQAMQAIGGLPNPPTSESLQRLAEWVIRTILAEGTGASPGATIRMVTRDADGVVVGEGKFVLATAGLRRTGPCSTGGDLPRLSSAFSAWRVACC